MSDVRIEIEWKKLEKKLTGLEKYVPRNSMKAASSAAFKVINRENARLIGSASYKTRMEKPAMRDRGSKKGGYRVRRVIQSRDGSVRSKTDYNSKKHPEMIHAWFVERGYKTKNGRVEGRHFRTKAFKAKRREAASYFMKALEIAIDVATSNSKGRVSMKDIEGVLGKVW